MAPPLSGCDSPNASCPAPTPPPAPTPSPKTEAVTADLYRNYQILDRIIQGTEFLQNFPLPSGHQPMLKLPLPSFRSPVVWETKPFPFPLPPFRIGIPVPHLRSPITWGKEAYLHIDGGAYLRGISNLKNGAAESGYLQLMGGRVGLTFEENLKAGESILSVVDTIRFENGRIFGTIRSYFEQRAEASSSGFGRFCWTFVSWLSRPFISHFLGPRNSRGEYDLTSFFENHLRGKGGQTSVKGLRLANLATLAQSKFSTGGAVVSRLSPPDYHQVDARGSISLKNPIYSDPTTGDVVEIGRIENEIHLHPGPTASSSPEAVGFDVERVSYKNRLRGTNVELEGLRFFLHPNFQFRDLRHVIGSGQLQWDRATFSGIAGEDLFFGCARGPCQSPEKIDFDFEVTPGGVAVDLKGLPQEVNEIYTGDGRIAGVIANALARVYFGFDRSLTGEATFDLTAQTAKPIPLTGTLQASGQGTCSVRVGGNRLMEGDFDGQMSCEAEGSRIESKKPEVQVRLPVGTRARLRGNFWKEGAEVGACLQRWSSQVEVEAPQIVEAMKLLAKTTGPIPVMKNACVKVHPDGKTEIDIDGYEATVASDLSSDIFRTSMNSDLVVARLHSTFWPNGRVRIEPQKRSRVPYFLKTIRAQGQVELPNGVIFPVEDASLEMSRVDFNYEQETADIRGHLELWHENIPNEYLQGLPFSIRSLGGYPQHFMLHVVADHWRLTRKGVVQIVSGRFEMESMDHTPAPPLDVAVKKERSPYMLRLTIPPLAIPPEEKGAVAPNDLLSSLAQLAAGLFGTVARINRFDLKTPEIPGEPTVSIFGKWLTLSLRFPERTEWEVESATQPDPQTGKESFAHLSIHPEAPVRVCINLFGHCITQEEFQFEKIELVTTNPPPADFDFSTWSSKEPEGWQAGELVLHWNGMVQPPLVKMLLGAAGVSDDTAERQGVKIEKDRWRIPLDLAEIQALASVAARSSVETKGGPSVGRSANPLADKVIHPPALKWDQTYGVIDLILKGINREICTGEEGPHPHLFLETQRGSNLVVSRATPQGPIELGPIRFPSLGIGYEEHPGRFKEPQTSIIDLSQIPFFLFLRGLKLDPMGGESSSRLDLNRGAFHGRLAVDQIPFRIGHPGKDSLWEGGISQASARNFEWTPHPVLEVDPYDPARRTVPVVRVKAEEAAYRFEFRKEPQPGVDRHKVRETLFAGAPDFRNLYGAIYPDRVEVGYDSVTDRATYSGLHFGVKDVDYSARGAFMATHLGAEIGQGRVWIKVPKLEVRSGAIQLGPGTVQVARKGTVQGTTLIIGEEKVELSCEKVNVAFKGLGQEFVRKLGLPEGMTIDRMELDSVDFEGAVAEGSYMSHGDINLVGPIRITSRGRVAFSYKQDGIDIQHFESPITVRFNRVNHLKTSLGQLASLDFEEMEMSFADVDTSIGLLGFLQTHLKSFPSLQETGLPLGTQATLRVKKGSIEIERDEGGIPTDPTALLAWLTKDENIPPRASLKLEGISIDLTGHSHETEMQFRDGRHPTTVQYPELDLTVDAKEGKVNAVRTGGKWSSDVNVGPFKMVVTVKGTKIKAH